MSKFYKIVTILSIVILIVGAVGFSNVAYAVGQETCPDSGGWSKFSVNAQSITYTAPEGFLISGWCYKAGETVKSGVVDPPAASITLTSDVLNPPGNAFLDISHASILLVPVEDNTCEQTVQSEGPWSDWVVDPNDPTREVRERTITLYDAEDPSVVCSSYPEYEYRPVEDNTCEQTVLSEGEWSDWIVDPNDPTREVRERTITLYDAEDDSVVCDSYPEYEYRPVEDNTCEQTVLSEGPWSGWIVDPNDPTREVRERTITLYDAEDDSVVCDSYPEYEYRPLDPEDVLVYVDPEGICRWTGSESEWTYHAIITGGEDGWVAIDVVNPSLSFSTVGTHDIVVIGPGSFSWSTTLNNLDAELLGDVEGSREFGTCEPKIDPTPTPSPTPPPNIPPAGAGTPLDLTSTFLAMIYIGSGGTALSFAGYLNSKKKEKNI